MTTSLTLFAVADQPTPIREQLRRDLDNWSQSNLFNLRDLTNRLQHLIIQFEKMKRIVEGRIFLNLEKDLALDIIMERLSSATESRLSATNPSIETGLKALLKSASCVDKDSLVRFREVLTSLSKLYSDNDHILELVKSLLSVVEGRNHNAELDFIGALDEMVRQPPEKRWHSSEELILSCALCASRIPEKDSFLKKLNAKKAEYAALLIEEYEEKKDPEQKHPKQEKGKAKEALH